MKLIIDIPEEFTKDELERAIINATPFDTVIKDIKAEIITLSNYESNDGQNLIMVADALECIDKHISGKDDNDNN